MTKEQGGAGRPLSAALTRLCAEARAAGFTVRLDRQLLIYKTRGKTVTLGVIIYLTDTGAFFSANRADTDLSVCTAIRTIKGVRRALELEQLAYYAGAQARRMRRPLSANPYHPASDLRDAWRNGWDMEVASEPASHDNTYA